MRILESKAVPGDVWGYYKATRKLYSSRGKHDLFSGKGDGTVVAMKYINEQKYQAFVIEIDPDKQQDLFEDRDPEYIKSIWDFVAEYF